MREKSVFTIGVHCGIFLLLVKRCDYGKAFV